MKKKKAVKKANSKPLKTGGKKAVKAVRKHLKVDNKECLEENKQHDKLIKKINKKILGKK